MKKDWQLDPSGGDHHAHEEQGWDMEGVWDTSLSERTGTSFQTLTVPIRMWHTRLGLHLPKERPTVS